MFENHWSSCALHNGPARWPMPCDCGGFKDDKLSEPMLNRSDCSPVGALKKWLQLWKARIIWKRENRESLGHFLRTVAKHSMSRHHLNQHRAGAARPSAIDPCIGTQSRSD